MSNSFKVVDRVLKEAMRIAHEKCQFIGTTDRQYDSSFTYRPNAGPNGQTLRIRNPNQYIRRTGSRIMDVQDQAETSQTITVATQDGVDMRFNSTELIQSVNSEAAFDDLSKNYIQPAVSSLVSAIEGDYIAYATKATYNLAGTAGTPPTDLVAVGAARAKLNQHLAPKDGNRFIMADSVTMGGMVNGLKGLFQDSAQIKEQYREGMMGRTAMADWYENDRMYTHTNSAGTAAVALDTYTIIDGDADLTVATTTTAWAAGTVFTIADLYAVHPETKTPIGLQQFTVLAGSTATNVLISPTIYITGAKRNVGTSTGAAITASSYTTKTCTIVGSASTSYLQNLMYHKEAFQFITADLPLMDDAHKCQRVNKDGLSLRLWMGSDIRNDELLLRLDILYGFAALRPEWACRITN